MARHTGDAKREALPRTTYKTFTYLKIAASFDPRLAL